MWVSKCLNTSSQYKLDMSAHNWKYMLAWWWHARLVIFISYKLPLPDKLLSVKLVIVLGIKKLTFSFLNSRIDLGCMPDVFPGQCSNSEYWEQQHKHLVESLTPGLLEEYGEEYLLETKELFQLHASRASEDLGPVISTIADALTSPQPKVRYYAGPRVLLLHFIHTYLPTFFSDEFLQRLFVNKKVMPQALRKTMWIAFAQHDWEQTG